MYMSPTPEDERGNYNRLNKSSIYTVHCLFAALSFCFLNAAISFSTL